MKVAVLLDRMSQVNLSLRPTPDLEPVEESGPTVGVLSEDLQRLYWVTVDMAREIGQNFWIIDRVFWSLVVLEFPELVEKTHLELHLGFKVGWCAWCGNDEKRAATCRTILRDR